MREIESSIRDAAEDSVAVAQTALAKIEATVKKGVAERNSAEYKIAELERQIGDLLADV
jgi:ribosomal protein S20